MDIAIVTGSTRPDRKGPGIAAWVLERAAARTDARFTLVDIAEVRLPLLDEPSPPIAGRPTHPHTLRWSQTISAFDGYVFVTPEYNRSTSAALKNAIDFLFAEWNDKACAFVGYGVSGGQRAVEHLRLVAAELKLADVRTQVALTLGQDTDGDRVRPGAHDATLDRMLGELVAWSRALAPLRAREQAA